jgi:transposase
MAKPTKLTEQAVAYAQQQVQTTRDTDCLRRALAVLIPARTRISQVQTAAILGIGVATVKRYQKALCERARGTDAPEPTRGGRHNETIPLEAEKAFLEHWAERAGRGEVVVVKQLREDLQRRVGARIPLYTLYRILDRHGWRKLVPDTKHPNGDPEAREAFKKTSAPAWLPPSEAIAHA